ncbi:MAG: leucyl/phenylalanyl-tRNA--protein transferase [Verrucomicrobiota bacterium]
MAVYLESEQDPLPEPNDADRNGLVAIGGQLTTKRLLEAYRKGIFPWSQEPVTWWSPETRAVFYPLDIRISKSLQKKLNQAPYEIRFNHDFNRVIHACAAPRKTESSWIGSQFTKAYCDLHALGIAQSVECWQGDDLVGGLYGLSLGGLFAGESMFFRKPDASKIALVSLCQHLKAQGFLLIDSQVPNAFTLQMGAKCINRDTYLGLLKHALSLPVSF